MAVARGGSIAFSLLPFMWRAWWRKQEQRGVWHGANTATAIVLALGGLAAVLFGSVFSFAALQHGATERGIVVLELCLNTVLMGWLAVPIMVGSTTAEGRGVQPMRLGQFPLKMVDLVWIGLLGRLVQPVYWILLGASAVTLLPLSVTPQPLPGLTAGLLFLAICSMLAWSVELFGSALFSSRRGREIMMLIVLLLLVPMMLLLWGDYSLEDDSVSYSLMGNEWLLLNATGTEGVLLKARVFSPSLWVSGAADGSSIWMGLLLLGSLAVLSAGAAFLSLKRVMLHPPSSLSGGRGAARTIGGIAFLSDTLGPLVVKEVRYLTRTLDHLMGVGMGVAALIWILIRPDHLPFVLPLASMNIVFNESAIPLNNFGLDGSGTDRYRLLPLSGRQVLVTKNLAYFIVVGIHLIPLILAGLFKGAGWLTLATVLATAAVCIVTAAGGNITSVRAPAPRAFFNFDSKEQTGGGLSLGLAGLVWGVPVGVYFGLLSFGMPFVALGMAVLLIIGWLIYRSSLAKTGKQFEERGESMRARLNKE